MTESVEAGGWEPLLVEILRFGSETGFPGTQDRYLVTCGVERARTYESRLTAQQFIDWLKEIRAATQQPGAQRQAAQQRVLDEVTDMLSLDPATRPRQVDFVINHSEIAALPFEAANATDGLPLLVGHEPPTVFTRRVRGAFRERTPGWPTKPRVLLAASAPLRAIPLDAHKQAMRTALGPWIEPLEGFAEAVPHEERVLTKLDDASLEQIAETCRTADPPFTHVHLLAHGVEIGEGFEQRFGLELASTDGSGAVAASGDDIARALCGGELLPTVVTLTACDSANAGSPVVTGQSAAYALHTRGVPVVVGSQFPMTFHGSSLTVERFYGRLLAGDDVRDALLAARCALHDASAQTGEDWKGLVAYAQLPEGYQDRLLDVRLGADLASLQTAQRWADHLVEHGAPATRYDDVIDRMRERIASLEGWADESLRRRRRDLREESRGLLGSAHKRLAELYFRRAALEREPTPELELCRQALEAATHWYEQAFADDLGAHWVAVQQLSLEAVVHGQIEEPWRWNAALAATRRTPDGPADAIWQCGSRAELHLLAPYAGQPRQLDRAVEALVQLARLVPAGDPFPIDSTSRQLRRYVEWWTKANGFFPDHDDLGAEAVELLDGPWRG